MQEFSMLDLRYFIEVDISRMVIWISWKSGMSHVN